MYLVIDDSRRFDEDFPLFVLATDCGSTFKNNKDLVLWLIVKKGLEIYEEC